MSAEQLERRDAEGQHLPLVVTISRQMGSLGRQVARKTADLLECRVMMREVINQAARLSGAPEAAIAAIDELGLLDFCPSEEDCQAYRQAVKQVMFDMAARENVVIVGRAGQVILKDRPNVLHVRVVAPLPARIERISRQQNISEECAQAQIEASDKYRKNYLKKFYQVRWNDENLYDLIINTGRVTPPAAADLIIRLLQNQFALAH